MHNLLNFIAILGICFLLVAETYAQEAKAGDTLFVIKRISVSTANGIHGIDIGKKVVLKRDDITHYVIRDGEIEAREPKDFFTSSADLAKDLQNKEKERAAAAYHAVQKAKKQVSNTTSDKQTPNNKATVKQSIFATTSLDSIYDYISDISLGWRSTSKTMKSESQKQVLFRDTTGHYVDVFLEAVEDINRTFGYQKLLPQLSTKGRSKDEAVVLLIASKSEGRRFLRNAGAHGGSASGAWDGWFWHDASQEMSKAAIAIYLEDVTDHSIKYYIRRSLLTALGYPGYAKRSDSIFYGYRPNFPNQKDISAHDSEAVSFISDWDVAILRFCDRFLATGASRSNIRKIISQEWPAFAARLDKTAEIRQANK